MQKFAKPSKERWGHMGICHWSVPVSCCGWWDGYKWEVVFIWVLGSADGWRWSERKQNGNDFCLCLVGISEDQAGTYSCLNFTLHVDSDLHLPNCPVGSYKLLWKVIDFRNWKEWDNCRFSACGYFNGNRWGRTKVTMKYFEIICWTSPWSLQWALSKE